MLRNILITLGLIVALLQYMGFPYSIARWIWTFCGVAIVLLLSISRKSSKVREAEKVTEETPRSLHVERTEVQDFPRVHIERSTVTDTEHIVESPGENTTVEKTVTVVRKRRRKEQQEEIPRLPEAIQ